MDECIYKLLINNLIESIPIIKDYKIESHSKEVCTKITSYTIYKVMLCSDVLQRKIEFGMIDYYDHRTILMNIYKIGLPNKNLDDYLFISSYLSKHLNIDDVNMILNLSSDPDELLDSKLQDFFTRFISIVDDLFFKIIEGKAWLRIPFDWGPYK